MANGFNFNSLDWIDNRDAHPASGSIRMELGGLDTVPLLQ